MFIAPKNSLVWLLIVSFTLAALSCDAKISVQDQMQLGNPSGATANPNDHSHYLITRPVFAADYDDQRGEPNWVSWDLTAEDMGPAKRSPQFKPDYQLPGDFQHTKSSDYKQSGYDRGHMCPSADRTDNATDNEGVFVMSNIMPQSKDNNQGVWEKLEADCRELARNGDELLITCGPAGFSDNHLPNGPELIPARTWKIVVAVPSGPGSVISRITAQTRVIAVDIPNIEGIRTDPWQKYAVSVNQLEAETGLKFFSALPADVSAILKLKVDGLPMPKVAVPVNPAQAPQTPEPNQPPQSSQLVLAGIIILSVILVLGIVALVLLFKLHSKQ